MAASAPKLPGKVVVALALAVVLDTVTHIAWKLAVAHLPEGETLAAVAGAALTSPLFLVAMVAFLAQFYNWMRVLEHADLSFAQPITALGYIAVLVISARALHEPVSATRIAGVILILAGVFFISRTPHRTTVPPP
jgi:drug/metabolite transporter (DMT)-like permease